MYNWNVGSISPKRYILLKIPFKTWFCPSLSGTIGSRRPFLCKICFCTGYLVIILQHSNWLARWCAYCTDIFVIDIALWAPRHYIHWIANKPTTLLPLFPTHHNIHHGSAVPEYARQVRWHRSMGHWFIWCSWSHDLQCMVSLEDILLLTIIMVIAHVSSDIPRCQTW